MPSGTLQEFVALEKICLWVKVTEGLNNFATTDTSYYGFPDLKSGTVVTIHMSHSTGRIIFIHKKQSFTTDSAMAAKGVGDHLHARRVLPLQYISAELGYPQSSSKFYMYNEPFMKNNLGQRSYSERSNHILYNIIFFKKLGKMISYKLSI